MYLGSGLFFGVCLLGSGLSQFTVMGLGSLYGHAGRSGGDSVIRLNKLRRADVSRLTVGLQLLFFDLDLVVHDLVVGVFELVAHRGCGFESPYRFGGCPFSSGQGMPSIPSGHNLLPILSWLVMWFDVFSSGQGVLSSIPPGNISLSSRPIACALATLISSSVLVARFMRLR